MPTTVRVALHERHYEIEIGRGNLAEVARFVTARTQPTSAVVITDSNVQSPHADRAQQLLISAGIRAHLLTVPAGEATKCSAQADRLWNELVRLPADRKTVIIAIGGGVVGDLAGFIAATFARGLSFFQIPTTLLAQVDSSVGGKVGINLPDAKNMVGAFWQPAGVLIDLDLLASLPDREYRSGLAEVVKYGVILDVAFFEYLESHVDQLNARHPETLEYVVARCCRLKADIVEQDEREETGLRAVLNYGHTFAHAIEATTGYGRYLHGEAVAIGMVYASRLAEQLDRIDVSQTTRQSSLLTRLGLPTMFEAASTADELLSAMQHDKKTEGGQLRFILPTRLGHVELVRGIQSDLVHGILKS